MKESKNFLLLVTTFLRTNFEIFTKIIKFNFIINLFKVMFLNVFELQEFKFKHLLLNLHPEKFYVIMSVTPT
jgi:hypothetical protein